MLWEDDPSRPVGWTGLQSPRQAMHMAARWLRPQIPKAQAAEQSPGGTESFVVVAAAPPAGSWAGSGFYWCRFSFQRTQMEFPVGTLGLGSEPRRAARLAGGTLNGLEEGARARSKRAGPGSPALGRGLPLTTAS